MIEQYWNGIMLEYPVGSLIANLERIMSGNGSCLGTESCLGTDHVWERIMSGNGLCLGTDHVWERIMSGNGSCLGTMSRNDVCGLCRMLVADFLTADLERIMSGNNGIMSGNDCRLLTLPNATCSPNATGWLFDCWLEIIAGWGNDV